MGKAIKVIGTILQCIVLVILFILPFIIVLCLKLTAFKGISWFWVWFALWGNAIVWVVAWYIIATIVIKIIYVKCVDYENKSQHLE